MTKDWRQNPPTYWILHKKDEWTCPTIIFETKDQSEALRYLHRTFKEGLSGIYRLETRTERA